MLEQQDFESEENIKQKITIKVVTHVIKIINLKYCSHAGKYSETPILFVPLFPKFIRTK